MELKHKVLVLGAAAALGGAALPAAATVGNAQSSGPASASFGIHRSATAQEIVDVFCDNSGSTINITSDIPIEDVSGSLTLSNNVKGTHLVTVQDTEHFSVQIGDGNYPISLGPKAPAFGGSGGNPHFILELRDQYGTVLTDDNGNPMDFYIGRCVAPSTHLTANILDKFPENAFLDEQISGVSCGSDASQLDIKAAAFDVGVQAWIVMVNQVQKGLVPGTPGVHYSQVQGTLLAGDVISSGLGNRGKGWWDVDHTIHGPGGNPLVYTRPDGDEGDSQFGIYDVNTESTWGLKLGRCNKLA